MHYRAEEGQGPVSQSHLHDLGYGGPAKAGHRLGHDGLQVILHVLRGDLLLRGVHQGNPDVEGGGQTWCQGTVHGRPVGRGGPAEGKHGPRCPAYGPGQRVCLHGAYNDLIKDTNVVRSMSRAGKPTDNPVNAALNGRIKEELYVEFRLDQTRHKDDFKQTIEQYVKYYNTQRPCFAIGYDTPEHFRKRYYKGELPKKQTFESRVLSPEPKFVQKRRQLVDNKRACETVSTFGKEIAEKSCQMSTFVKSDAGKTSPVSILKSSINENHFSCLLRARTAKSV